jgi:DNA polymerase zeta
MKRFNMNFDINGRIMLNIWRICRSELKLTDYSLENVIFEVCGFKFPFFANTTLVNWFLESKESKARVLNHYIKRIKYTHVKKCKYLENSHTFTSYLKCY